METCNVRSTEFRIGTKPLTNVIAFHNKNFPSNISYTDFGKRVFNLDSEIRHFAFKEFLQKASDMDAYEYYIFLEKSQKLSKYFFNNLSLWPPLLRYQIDLAVLKPCTGPIFDSKSSHYSTTSFLEEDTSGPFLISSRYMKKFIKSYDEKDSIVQSLNKFLKIINSVCFWPTSNFAFDDVKNDPVSLEFPIIFPDGVPNKFYNNDYLDLATITVQKNVIYIGSSAADLLVLAQSACKVIAFKNKNLIDYINTKIWLERFGLENRVEFVDEDSFMPQDESYAVVYSSFQDLSKDLKTKYLPFFPYTIFIGRSESLREAVSMNIPVREYSQNIKVKV